MSPLMFALNAVFKKTEAYFDVLPGFLMKDQSDLAPHMGRRRGLVLRLVVYFFYVIKIFISPNRGNQIPQGARYLFYCSSLVQYGTLIKIHDQLDFFSKNSFLLLEGGWVQDHHLHSNRPSTGTLKLKRFDIGLATIISVFRIPSVLVSGIFNHRMMFVSFFLDRMLMAPLYLLTFYRLFDHNKSVEAVILSNDHNIQNRVIRYVAECFGKKTFYVQHSSVGKRYPPLEFDVALLEGLSSYQQYLEKSTSQYLGRLGSRLDAVEPKIYLCGVQIAPSKLFVQKHAVGVCVNLGDCWKRTEILILNLLQNGYWVHLRVHPRQSKAFVTSCINLSLTHARLQLSDPKVQNLADFAAGLCFAICSNTSAIRELVLLTVPVFYKLLGDDHENYDRYGYVAQNLVPDFDECADIERYRTVWTANPDYKSRVKAISGTIDTPWYGRESELMGSVIVHEIENKPYEHPSFATCVDNPRLYSLV